MPSPGQFPGWPPAGPPPGNRNLKWILVATVAIVAIIAATVIVLNKGSAGGPTNAAGSGAGPAVAGGASSSASPIASAGDTGPITIITDEPTCAAFMPINNSVATVAQNGWDKRDPSVPASDLTSEQRSQYQAVGSAMSNAADQFVTLAKQTPHRIVRELYEQMIAYGRAYANSIPHLTQRDDYLSRVFNSATSVLVYACDSIEYGSAASRTGLAEAAPTPSQVASVNDPAKPQRFLTTDQPFCSNWKPIAAKLDNTNTSLWVASDATIPAAQWTPEQKAVYDTFGKLALEASDGAIKLAGQQGVSPTLTDFLDFAAVYFRIYIKALPTYVSDDAYLANVGMLMTSTLSAACGSLGAWS